MPKPTANEIADTIVQELDHFSSRFRVTGGPGVYFEQAALQREPFIGFLEVERQDGDEITTERYLVCRNYIPGPEFKARNAGIEFMSYKAALGRLVAAEPGVPQEIDIPNPLRRPRKARFHIFDKAVFRARKSDGVWDATDANLFWPHETAYFASLRSLLASPRAEAPRAVRAVAVSVALPDQAILDATQDELFRLPLESSLILTGAPGTGKTTVIIKRLAQKSQREFLTAEEQAVYDRAGSKENGDWVMFTPSDLLQNYLKEALAKEGLPAGEEHVRVWSVEKTALLRDLGILKIGGRGLFVRDPKCPRLLRDQTSPATVRFRKAAAAGIASSFSMHCRTAIEEFAAAASGLRQHFDDAAKTPGADTVSAVLSRLNAGLAYVAKLEKAGRAILAEHPEVTPANLHALWQLIEDAPGDRLPALPGTGQLAVHEAKRGELEKALLKLEQTISVSNLMQRLPMFYQEWREAGETFASYFDSAAADAMKRRRVDGVEGDVLLVITLDYLEAFSAAGQPVSALESVWESRRKALVAVDEATDFSALEIEAMRRLSRLGVLSLCGDPMQRLTSSGIGDWDELTPLLRNLVLRPLRRSYRQTHRLLEISKALYRQTLGKEADFLSAYPARPEDPPPLLRENLPHYGGAAEWIGKRIVEIYEINGGTLPTIGVIVPGLPDVAPMADVLRDVLAEDALEVEASLNGQSLGNSARVRVFPVEVIKGLEFEAAFFVHFDKVVEADAEAASRYLYVGLSRARSFLGVICTGRLPLQLDYIRTHFEKHEAFQAVEV